jgi:hypothetical protein
MDTTAKEIHLDLDAQLLDLFERYPTVNCLHVEKRNLQLVTSLEVGKSSDF